MAWEGHSDPYPESNQRTAMLILKKKDCRMELRDDHYERNVIYASDREEEVIVITEIQTDLLLSPTSVSYESTCPCWLTGAIRILKNHVDD